MKLQKVIWKKIGHIYCAQHESDWVYSHGKCRAFAVTDKAIKAYVINYGKPTTEGQILSRTFRIDLDRQNPTRIICRHPEPVLSLGRLGEFDEHGIMAECIVRRGSELWMYYDGWSRRDSVPYDWSIGLAISRDEGDTFLKQGCAPLIGPCQNEPFLFASPFVMSDCDGKLHMWYLGGDAWKTDHAGKPYAIYTIKHATSSDGISWSREHASCIPQTLDAECQAGPSVFEKDGCFHMIFSYRSSNKSDGSYQGYRLGYAISRDLNIWSRCDESLDMLGESASWDYEMMCYPQVVEVDDRIFLFYSGNDYGRTGFGVAELVRTNATYTRDSR